VKKIGVLGGTFNPVHLGHMAVAAEAMGRLGLNEIRFLPAGRPWMKESQTVVSARYRVNMLKLAIGGKPAFSILTMEIERPGLTYTVETMARLRDLLEEDDELYFIMSWGTLATLPEWREPGRLVELCHLVAVPRPGYPRPDLGALEVSIPGLSQRVVMLDGPQVAVSATEIRRRVAQDLDLSQLVPAAVAGYIKEHRLYRAEEGN